MKRRLFILVSCLFLGAATSFVIAWSIAVYVQDRFQTRRDRLIDGYATYYSEWGSREQVDFHGVVVWTVYRFGAAQTGFELPETNIEWLGKLTAPTLKPWSMRRILGPEFAQNGWLAFEDMGYGWPRIAMSHTWLDNTPAGVHQMFPDSIQVGRWNLPNRVVWNGFFLNTAFYAMIWFALPWSFTQTRRAVRKRRGRCAKCAYDLRGTSGGEACPECGATTVSRRAGRTRALRCEPPALCSSAKHNITTAGGGTTMKYTRRDLIQMGVGGSAALLAGWRPVWAQATRSANVTSQRKRPIPSTGERIPCMGLGTSRTFNADTSDEQRAPLKDVLRLFHEMGGTVLDTAPSYGKAEIVSGDLMRDLGIRSDLFVATKVGTRGKAEGVEQMQASLRRLQTGQVDLMQVHNLADIQTQLPTVRQWKDQGRVRYVGMTTSSRRQYEDFERWMKSEPLDFVQLDYSIGQREAAERLLPLAVERGMAVMVNRPFMRGRLFQKTRGQALPEWCAEFECSSWGQFFLKYVLSHPAVTVVIPATSKSDHLRDNMAAGLGRLPDEAMRKRMEGLIDAL